MCVLSFQEAAYGIPGQKDKAPLLSILGQGSQANSQHAKRCIVLLGSAPGARGVKAKRCLLGHRRSPLPRNT